MMTNANIHIGIVETQQDFNQAMKFRHDEFVVKQNIPEAKEFDGNDFSATHFILKNNDEVIGYMRARYFGPIVKFERMVIKEEYRGKSDYSKQLMNYGFNFCAQKGCSMVYGVCKKELLNLWEKVGYQKIDDAEAIKLNNMDLIPIKYDLSKHQNNPVNEKTHFDVFCAKESQLQDAQRNVSNTKISIIMNKVMQSKLHRT